MTAAARFALLAAAPAAGCTGRMGAAGPWPVQGGPASGPVVINEVAPAIPDEPDWVELHNRGDEEADLSGHFLTDSVDRLDHYYELPAGTRLAPGGYLVVRCGGDGDGPRAPFRLSRAEGVHLVAPDGLIADGLLYYLPEPGRTLARRPDGGDFFDLSDPTPGAANPPALLGAAVRAQAPEAQP